MKKLHVEDNFLGQKEFVEIQDFCMGSKLLWQYSDTIDNKNDVEKFQFVHMFHADHSPQSSFCDQLIPIIDIIDPLSIFRIKANLLTRTHDIVENALHVDIGHMSEEKLKQWTTAIFYVNTNNGYTKFEDGTKVESVANRMVIFPANLKHTGTSCSDDKARIVINFNYFKH